MKKNVCVFIFILFVSVFAFSQAVTLDNALRNSTTYLNGRIKENTKVVVLNFTSKWPELSDYIIDEIIGYVVNDGNFAVVDRNNLETIRKELNFQLSGEVSDETAQSIGKMLGAQTIINGNITAIGSSYRLRVRAISVESAQIIGMHNVDVAQDSRIAALTGTASAGPVAVVPVAPTNTPATTTTPAVPANTGTNALTVIPPTAWTHGKGDSSGTTKKNFTGREVIEGQERDVLTLEVTFLGNGEKWGTFAMGDESIVSKVRTASGVRFKALGDGKRWILFIDTTDLSTSGNYETDIKTINNRVVEIDIPFSSLKQPSWATKRASFIRNNIRAIGIQRKTPPSGGTSTLKIFDFEVY